MNTLANAIISKQFKPRINEFILSLPYATTSCAFWGLRFTYYWTSHLLFDFMLRGQLHYSLISCPFIFSIIFISIWAHGYYVSSLLNFSSVLRRNFNKSLQCFVKRKLYLSVNVKIVFRAALCSSTDCSNTVTLLITILLGITNKQ